MKKITEELIRYIWSRFNKTKNGSAFFINNSVFDHMTIIKEALSRAANRERVMILDVGGGDGFFLKSIIQTLNLDSSNIIEIHVLDLATHDHAANRRPSKFYSADICSKDAPEIIPHRFDIVFSYNALEHFPNPFIAAKNMIGFLDCGGILICSTVFSWRFHPVPNDYFRFSTEGLRQIFSVEGGLKTIQCGYDLSRRRENIVGGYFGDKDIPPLDWLGGFRENWIVTYVGEK